MREEHESEIALQMNDLKAHYESVIEDMVGTQEAELTEAITADRTGFASRLEEIAEQNDFKLEELRIELSEHHADELEKALSEVKDEHVKELVQLQASFEAHLKATANADKQLLASQMQNMKTKSEENQAAALENLRVQLAESYSKEREQVVREIKAQHDAHIEELTTTLGSKFQQGISADKQGFEKKLREVLSKSEETLGIKIEEAEELRAELQKTHMEQMKDQERRSKEHLAAEREKFESQLADTSRVGQGKLSTALDKLKAEHKVVVTSLQEQHDKTLKTALESANRDFKMQLAEVNSAHDQALDDLSTELIESNNKATEETVSKMILSHQKQVEKLKAAHQIEVKEALAAEGEDFHAHLKILTARSEEKHTAAIEELRIELSEAHVVLLAQTVRDLKKNSEIEKQSALCESRNTADQHHSALSKELVETLGKEGRDALEAQRMISMRERAADMERMRGEMSALTDTHEAAVAALKADALKVQQRHLEDQKRDLENSFKLSARDREKASERAIEASSALLTADREAAVTNMRAQHVRY